MVKRILVDVFGGDEPMESVKGAVEAVKANKDIKCTLVGGLDEIKKMLKAIPYSLGEGNIDILNASDVVTNYDKPTSVMEERPDSSMVVGLNALKEQPEKYMGLVTTGSTGAMLVCAFRKFGRIKGVSRPALAPFLPTFDGGRVILIDAGANIDCKPLYLLHFAIMADAFLKTVYGIERPRIALLSNGTEDSKGNELNKEAFALLKAHSSLNFLGNVEGREIASGAYDIVVTDGFAGNIALKSMEGTAIGLLRLIKKELTTSGILTKLGAGLCKKAFKRVQKVMDYNELPGSPVLGINNIVFKSHGSSKAKSVRMTIERIKHMYESGAVEKLAQALQE
ncbi:MAG: phosphate acyltransferase PlsX [Firmicutes bacterium]|nr:phosphate acyltransferase PlsX [Bacillota bacterium]